MNQTTNRPAAPLAALDRIALHADSALKEARLAAVLLSLPVSAGRTQEALDRTERAGDAAAQALDALLTAGATLHALPKPGVNLAALDTMDTPDTRALLDLLDAAQAVAERIDRQRGRHVADDMPLAPFESRGTDLAEGVSLLALRVRGEVFGAAGKGLE